MVQKKNNKLQKKQKKLSVGSTQKSFLDEIVTRYTDKYGLLILIFTILLVCFFVFYDFLIGDKVLLFKGMGSDSIDIFYANYNQALNLIKEGGVPFWSFHQGLGQNIFPGGLANPFNDILYLFGKENILNTLVYIEILKILLTGIIIYFYFNILSMQKLSSICGGIIFAFSGYIILGGSGWFDHSASVVYGAFLLFAFEKLYVQKSWYYFPVAIFFIAANNPFYLWTFGFFLFTYAVFRYLDDNGFEWKGLFTLIFKMGYLTVLGCLFASVFLFNSLSIMLDSPRGSGVAGTSDLLKQVGLFDLGNANYYLTIFFRLFSNDILGTDIQYKGILNYLEGPIFYSGLLSLLLLPQIFIFKKTIKKKLIVAGFILFWLVIALVPYLRFSYYLYTGDYFKGGLDFAIPVILIFFGIQALNNILVSGKLSTVLKFTTWFIFILLIFSLDFDNKEIIDNNLKLVIAVIMTMYIFLLILIQYPLLKGYSKIALILIIAFESGYFAYITYNNREVVASSDLLGKKAYNDYTSDALKYLDTLDNSFYRIHKDYVSSPAKHLSLNEAKIQGYYGLTSYSSFNQKYFIRFLAETGVIDPNQERQTRWAEALGRKPFLYYITNLKYYLSKSDSIKLTKLGYNLIAKKGDVRIFKNNDYIPFGFTYDNIMCYTDYIKLERKYKQTPFVKFCIIEDSDYDRFKSLIKFDLTDSLLIGKHISLKKISKSISELKKDTLKISKFSNNRIEGDIELKKTKILFFSIPFDKGWQAKIDGVEAKTFIANLGFTGVLVNKGKHHIELEFMPENLIPGTIISIVSFIGFVLLVAFSFKKKGNL